MPTIGEDLYCYFVLLFFIVKRVIGFNYPPLLGEHQVKALSTIV